MKSYYSKTIMVKAVKWTGNNRNEIIDFIRCANLCFSSDDAPCFANPNYTGGFIRVEIGEWIVKDVDGNYYKYIDETFKKKYY